MKAYSVYRVEYLKNKTEKKSGRCWIGDWKRGIITPQICCDWPK